MKVKVCAQLQMSEMLTAWYGPYTEETAEAYNLPLDKLEASMITFKVIIYFELVLDLALIFWF